MSDGLAAAGAAGICLGLFLLMAAGVATGFTTGVDEAALRGLHGVLDGSASSLFKVVSDAGGPTARTVVVVATALALVANRRLWSAGFVVISIGGTGLLDTLVKLALARPRPHLFSPAVSADGYGFPSGHAGGSAALVIAAAALLWFLTRRPRLTATAAVAGALLVALVGLSRLALGVHYPTDVIGGFALSGAWVAGVLVAFGPHLAAEGRQSPAQPQMRR